jgi:hypothetical protein
VSKWATGWEKAAALTPNPPIPVLDLMPTPPDPVGGLYKGLGFRV